VRARPAWPRNVEKIPIDYLEKAGQQALRDGAYQEAERLFEESLELDARSGVLSAGFYERA